MSSKIESREREVAFSLNRDLPFGFQKEILKEEIRSRGIPSVAERGGRRKILLIGGAGYIGTVITERLLRMGYAVRCLDLFLYRNQPCVLTHMLDKDYEFIFGDLADRRAVLAAVKGCTDVVILAGLVGDPITKKYPEVSKRINADGMVALVDTLDNRGLNKVIFVSTCSNYGLIGEDEKADEGFELNPLSLYASAKVAMEGEVLGRSPDADYTGTVLRCSTAFGLSPRMRFDLTVNEFTREMYLKRDLLVYDASTWRPYCHVKDFAAVVQRVLEAPRDLIDGEVFNAGGDGNNCTKQMIVDKVRRHFPDAPVRYMEQGADPRNYRVDFSKIQRVLHFTPEFSVDHGIAEVFAALEQNVFAGVEADPRFYGNYELEYEG
jgi:nucleoside-diphosphate-sugar epimerase